MESFNEEHPLNANIRNNGIGLRPNMAGIDPQAMTGTFACGSIMAYLTIPFGWHIFDDGKRTLVFDEGSTVQVNFNLAAGEGLTDEMLIEQAIADLGQAYPGAEWVTMELGGMKSLAIRGIQLQGEILDQVYIMKAAPAEGTWLVIRSTSLPVDTERVLNMIELIIGSLRLIG